MSGEHCSQCNKLFDRVGPNRVCFECVEADRKAYQKQYKKISPVLHKLNYLTLSAQTHHDPKRLMDLLQFRLGTSSHQPDLADLKKSVCYWCQHKMENLENLEPVCLSCLKSVAAAVESPQASQTSAKSASTTPSNHIPTRKFHSEAEDSFSASTSSKASKPLSVSQGEPQSSTVGEAPRLNCLYCLKSNLGPMCPECVRTLTAELKWYRREFGSMAEETQLAEIPGGEVISEERMQEAITQHEAFAQAHQEDSTHAKEDAPRSPSVVDAPDGTASGEANDTQRVSTTQESEAAVDDIQQLLDANDADLAAMTLENLEEELDVAFISTLDPEQIRKYGFKRLKYK
jgi:hypothetical protein